MRPLLITLAVFSAVTMLTQYLVYQRYLIAMDLEREKVNQEISSIRERLTTTLSYSLSATKTLAYIVKQYGVPANFDTVAKEIIQANKNIDALEITTGGVISHVYPLEGNELAIGYDILGDSLRNQEAYKAIERRELFFAGPFELKQGGISVVGRLPIFMDDKFFGFSVVLIKLSTLLQAAGLVNTENGEFIYQLSKINPGTNEEEFFMDQELPKERRNIASIEVPNGEWKLYVVLKENNKSFYLVVLLSFFGLIFSIITSMVAWNFTRQPEKLKRLVERKTQQLSSSEKYFRSLIEKSSDAIVLLDNSGKVLYQSPSTERISGYSLEEIQSLDSTLLIHPDDRERDSTLFEQLAQSPGAVVQRNHRFKHKQGHYIWVEGTYTNLLDDENVRGIVYNYHDVTQRVESEKRVIDAYKEKETVLNRINDAVVSVDNEWRYTFLNDAAIATHPAGREGTLGKTLLEVHPELAGTVFWEKYQEARQMMKVIEVESHYEPMDTWFMVKVYPSDDGLTIFYTDISDRRRAELRVMEERNFSVSIINSLPGIFYMYNRRGEFIRWNKNFEVVSGYSAAEIESMHPLNFFDDDEKTLLLEKIGNVFKTGKSDVIAHFYTKDRRKIPYYFNGELVIFNNVEYLIGMGIDITDRVKAENELRQRTEEIQELTLHLERIREEERIRMAREIHDELGQQLTGLKMDVAWIIRKMVSAETFVKEKISGMIPLIDETMKTVRRISSELRPGILDDLGLIPALEWQTSEFQKRTGIASTFEPRIGNFNPGKELSTNLFRVYQEALTNIARHANATLVKAILQQTKECVHLIIQDNGSGFDIKEVKKKRSLGLVGMRERARMVHGELTIESNQSQGTVVTLTVPLKADKLAPVKT